ncbi:hypothetical protein REPUB_Repub03eG0281300 [Reevesia pubescens]
MGSGTTPQVRLVRCPKCRLVLPEVADFAVYKCGGCDTILVAKNRKAIVKGTSVLKETEASEINKLVCLSEHGESSSSTLQEVLPSSPESQSTESGGNQNISSDSHIEKHGENLSVEGQHNNHYEKDQSTSSHSDSDKLDEKRSNERQQNGSGQLKLSQESGGNQNISSDSHSMKHGENLSIEGQHNDHYKDQSTSSDSDSYSDKLDEIRSNEGLQNGSGQLLLSQESGGNQNISSDSHSMKHGENLSIEEQHNDHYKKDQSISSDSDSYCDKLDENRSNEGQQNGSGQLQLESSEYFNVQQPGVFIEGSLSTVLRHENEELMLVAEASLEAEANDKTSQLEGAISELETNSKIDSYIGGLSIDNPPATREINLIATACAAAGEVISSDNLFSSPTEHLEQPQNSEHHGFDRVRSTDTFETADFVSSRSELSGPLEYLFKSTTTRSSHAYDGSISSYDGMDDHFPDQQMHSFENNYKPDNYLVPEGTHRRDKLPAKGMMNDGLLQPAMHHRPPKNWPRLERDEYPSQIPFSQRDSLSGYESAGLSRELHDEFPFDSAFHPLEKAEYTEHENMKLLRLVYELQDQVSKTSHLNGKPNGRTYTDIPWRQEHFPTYYYQEAPEDENFYPRYRGRREKRNSWNQQSRFLRIPFSGGAINTRHDIEKSCLSCHPQSWQHSEQLRPPIFRHNRGFCRAHPGHNCYNSYSSCPSSPPRYMESDFSIWSHETKSADQRYRDHELKRYLREKHHSVRRHLRPTAGGAPFVTCSHCFRPLQLPADFLLFKRRFHQLRCGACSKVLEFSLQKGIHIVPYELVAAKPPPSEVEDCSDAINVRISKSASCSHGCLQADPMSYSDDYGQSFCKSCSTDGDPVSHAQLHDLQGNADVRNMSSSSSKPMKQRKDFSSKQSQNKHKNSVETFDSAGPSSNMPGSEKMSLEVEELPTRPGGSPLHRLMGYSSPSQVINGF